MDNQIISTDGIFYKIRMFFRKLFKKEEPNNKGYIENEIVENKFKEEIVIKKDEEKERILELQKKFREKIVKEDDMSAQDLQKLSDLYDEQITNLREKIKQNIYETEQYKKEIILIRETKISE